MTPPTWIVPLLGLLKSTYNATIGKWLEKRRRTARDLRQIIGLLNECQLTYEIDGHLARFLKLLRLDASLFEQPSIAVFYERWIQPREEAIRLLGAPRDLKGAMGIDSGYWTQPLIIAMLLDLNRIKP